MDYFTEWNIRQNPLSTYQVVDNLYAALWAGMVLDLEAVVADFQFLAEWDYKSFLGVAEQRKILALHRSTFNLLPHEKGSKHIASDKWSRGRFLDQLSSYITVLTVLLNAAKDIWVEPVASLPNRNPIMDMKRNICGLYLLYYLWHNQIPNDSQKLLIKYSIDERKQSKLFFERLEKMLPLIPNSEITANCCKFVITALEKRCAFHYCFISDEPKLDFHFWEYMNLKKSVPRLLQTSINSNNHMSDLVAEVEKGSTRLIKLLNEVIKLAGEPLERSLLFRKILPSQVVKHLLLYDETSLEPMSAKLPVDYTNMANVVSTSMRLNLETIQRPFLRLDGLLRTSNSTDKLRLVGVSAASLLQKKHVYGKRSYEKSKANFNALCDKFSVNKRLHSTKKYRSMDSPAWLFVRKNFKDVFNPERSTEEVPKTYNTFVVPDEESLNLDPEPATTADVTTEYAMEDALSRRKRNRNLPVNVPESQRRPLRWSSKRIKPEETTEMTQASPSLAENLNCPSPASSAISDDYTCYDSVQIPPSVPDLIPISSPRSKKSKNQIEENEMHATLVPLKIEAVGINRSVEFEEN